MANEAEIINNPTSLPTAVSTGYQAQNTNLIAQREGVDKSNITPGVSNATLEISGPIDVNGVLYNIKSVVVFNLSTPGQYFISLDGAGPASLTPTLGTSSGTFDNSKNARYNGSGYRVLNWILDSDGTNVTASKLLTPAYNPAGIAHNYAVDWDIPKETFITVAGAWVAPQSKFYSIYVTGKGGNGGAAAAYKGGGSGGGGGGGGGGGAISMNRIYINEGDTWTATFSTASGGTTSFSDGTTTISAQNGFSGGVASATFLVGGVGGVGGASGVGYIILNPGNSGSPGDPGTTTFRGGTGGSGGDGAGGGLAGQSTGVPPLNGFTSFRHGGGGGGGGGAGGAVTTGSGGSGGGGLIRIVG